jgi:hypothetical protein
MRPDEEAEANGQRSIAEELPVRSGASLRGPRA